MLVIIKAESMLDWCAANDLRGLMLLWEGTEAWCRRKRQVSKEVAIVLLIQIERNL